MIYNNTQVEMSMAKTAEANSFDRPGLKGPVGDYDGSKEFNNDIYG